jgi:hypothetical protein
MVVLQLLAGSWLIAVYVLQVAWVRQQLLAVLPPLLPWLLLWLGLPVAGAAPDQAEVQGVTLELLLRAKAVILLAVALRQKAKRWQQQLPAAVAAVAAPCWPCPLFWTRQHHVTALAAAAAALEQRQQQHAPLSTPGSRNTSLGPAGSEITGRDAGPGSPTGPDSFDSANWEDLEPVLRRAEQLVSPLKAFMLKVTCDGRTRLAGWLAGWLCLILLV